ncbi:DNA modification methylase [Tabrizicola sp. BL-A-41-H6]|uniref:DNA modification methylase n=1 Tax=Tabrizicola sp. BL-A-41-H6 TaxID=3421107 RepID=UPI003D67D7BC
MDKHDQDKDAVGDGVDANGNPPGPEWALRSAWRTDFTPCKKIDLVAIDALKRSPRHIRRAKREQIERVKRSITAFGCVRPVLTSGLRTIIDGHVIVEALRELGAKVVPCMVIDHLSDLEIRKLAITLNKTQETGAWDEGALAIEFEELLALDVDLAVTGFEIAEIDFHLGHFSITDAETDLTEEPVIPAEQSAPAVTLQGDVWITGPHRVICGRAQDLAAWGTEMGPAAMLITDPPYNLPISGHVSTVRGRHAEFVEASGEMTPSAFTDFLVKGLRTAIACLEPGGVGFIFMDWRHLREILDAFQHLGVDVINLAVWVKKAAGMGSLYRSRHELVFVVRKRGASHRNNVQLGRFGRNRSNVWEYGGATSGNTAEDDFGLHPTVKPVALIRDAILDVSAPGELVIDCFLGSGSTLIAAETSGRRCLGVEIEPAYIDVALRRWMALTGREAVHAATGETFSDLAVRRAVKLLPAPAKGGSDV